MRRLAHATLVLCCTTVPAAAAAQAAPPSTDVFVAPLLVRNGVLTVGALTNATDRPGYDNQPAFLRDGSGVLYTRIGADGQADIYRYDLRTRSVTRLTSTPESEYSATPLPDGQSFSVVRVEADSAQRLWRFPLSGSTPPALLLPAVKPVGYHAWVDDSTLAMFVLGDPATLQVAGLRAGQPVTYARRIGRGLQPVPGARGFAFVQQAGDTSYLEEIRFLDAGGGGGTFSQRRLAKTLRGQDFFAYTPAGEVLAASGTTLYRWSRDCLVNDGWETVADLRTGGIRNISRLSVSPDGRWIALVGEPAP